VARTALKLGFLTDTVLHTAVILGLMHAGATSLSLRGPKLVEGIKADVVLQPPHSPMSSAVEIFERGSWFHIGASACLIATRLNAC
jgi:hypothetical protein